MPHRSHDHAGGPIEGRHSRAYDRLARWLMKPLYRRIAADVAASAPGDAALLDVGTGPGLLLEAIARARPDLRLSGIDIAADMIDHARRNLASLEERPDLRAADVADLPFEDGRFDLVVSTFSSHHWADPEAASSELARVLRSEGRLLNYDFRWAPFEALTRQPGLTGVASAPFRTGLGPIMRASRFEAKAA